MPSRWCRSCCFSGRTRQQRPRGYNHRRRHTAAPHSSSSRRSNRGEEVVSAEITTNNSYAVLGSTAVGSGWSARRQARHGVEASTAFTLPYTSLYCHYLCVHAAFDCLFRWLSAGLALPFHCLQLGTSASHARCRMLSLALPFFPPQRALTHPRHRRDDHHRQISPRATCATKEMT